MSRIEKQQKLTAARKGKDRFKNRWRHVSPQRQRERSFARLGIAQLREETATVLRLARRRQQCWRPACRAFCMGAPPFPLERRPQPSPPPARALPQAAAF